MSKPTKKEIGAEFDEIQKMYVCYRFLLSNADDEPTKRKIRELAKEHLSAKIKGVSIPVKMQAEFREEKLRKLVSVFES